VTCCAGGGGCCTNGCTAVTCCAAGSGGGGSITLGIGGGITLGSAVGQLNFNVRTTQNSVQPDTKFQISRGGSQSQSAPRKLPGNPVQETMRIDRSNNWGVKGVGTLTLRSSRGEAHRARGQRGGRGSQ
jgi:hypothetical protein